MTDTGGRILLLLAVLLAAPRVWAHETRPAPLSQVHFEQRLHAQLPLDLVLHDATGKSIRLGTYFGTKPVILVLSYYRCARLHVIRRRRRRRLKRLIYSATGGWEQQRDGIFSLGSPK